MYDSCGIAANDLITIEQALQKITATIRPVEGSEHVILKDAPGRILSTSVYSPINIPPDRNSAMDGYAFASTDIIPNQSFTLTLVGTSLAGKPYKEKLKKNECLRIFTGAVVPEGADSVIMQEHIEKNGQSIIFPSSTTADQNIREAGCDVKKNSELLSAPKKLSAVDIGLVAAAGRYDLIVKRKINIAYFSTGDELCSIGQELEPGQIYDSNRYTLSGLLDSTNFNIYDLGVAADDKQSIEETLISAAKTHDVIITTGGASVGEADYIKEILDKIAEIAFWKIAIKPGKPVAFGKIKDCYFFGLPGNPVSVIATFHKIVAPALQQLAGIPVNKTLVISASCTNNLKKQQGRQEYQRGVLTQNESGDFFVESAGKQGSNIMSTMSKANCYIVLPSECEGISAGQIVKVEPFETLL